MIYKTYLIVVVLLSNAVEDFSCRRPPPTPALLPSVESFSRSVAAAVGRLRVPTDNTTAARYEDADLRIDQLIVKYGYPVETHKVETDDGYVLTMYRIPGNGTAVFLMHGLLTSSDDFVIPGPESGLAYLLAQEGYDVWMGNARGNKHSRAHRTLRPSQREFWDFSWHEIGVLDLPAMIDRVLRVTGAGSLKYVGHSQGTTAFFVLASERPEYNDKIAVMAALSPVVFMAHFSLPMFRFLATNPIMIDLLNTVGTREFLPYNPFFRNILKIFCRGTVPETLCFSVVFLFVGFDVPQLNSSIIPVFIGHMPAGSSTKQLAHFRQQIISGEFEKFDYGTEMNRQMYGSSKPPKYALGRVSAPVALFYSDADQLAHPKDVSRLAQELPNVVEMYRVPNDNFNHLDFILAKDFKTLIFDRLLYILKKQYIR